jgi:hypothetical protein
VRSVRDPWLLLYAGRCWQCERPLVPAPHRDAFPCPCGLDFFGIELAEIAWRRLLDRA